MMQRYSRLTNQHRRREIVLLKGLPCAYGKCAFCNYIEDNTKNEDEIYKINKEVLGQITGEFGSLEVINSASIFELPKSTLKMIKQVIKDKNIHTLYCEAYYSYHKRLDEIREFFGGVEVRFIIGLETFDDEYRTKVLKKNFRLDEQKLALLSKQYYTVLLLICTKGQSREQILSDIKTARENFALTTISVFIENGTAIKRDEELVKWFLNELYPKLKEQKDVEILVDNKDFGVYVQ